MPSGRLRFAILLATVAAFLLVPVAQAAAEGLKVNIAGSGGGTVKTLTGFDGTEPPIECSYASPGPATGQCTQEAQPDNEENYTLVAIPAPGSKFTGWTVEVGAAFLACDGSEEEKELVEAFNEPPYEGLEGICFIGPEEGEAELTATFNEIPGFLLTIAKEGGQGTITSSPAGIECTGAKTGAECSYKFEGLVTLTASPATGYAFSGWGGCNEALGLTCKVTMDKAKTVKAKFIATPSLTVEKAGTGAGKVAATGIACDESCSKASSAVKAGTVVTLKVTAAKGSEAAVFEGGTGSAAVPACEGAGPCTFTISENSSVKVKFNAIPTKTMTVKLTGPAAYKGKVAGKGILKGLYGSAVNCGAGCTSQVETFFATDEVTLAATAGTGYSFKGWTVSGGSAGSCTSTTTPCTLKTDANKTVEAEFK